MIEGPSLDISEDLDGGEIVDKSLFCKMGLLIGHASNIWYTFTRVFTKDVLLSYCSCNKSPKREGGLKQHKYVIL